MAKKSLSKGALNNRANQLNPNHPAFHRSRGATTREAESVPTHTHPAVDNRANQINPNNDASRLSRGSSSDSGPSSNKSSAQSE